MHPDGSLKVIDRKKNLIKTNSGEYIALEVLEMVYGNSQFACPNGICVYADDGHDRPVALLSPNLPYVKRWAKENNMDSDDFNTLLRSKELHDAILHDLIFHSKKSDRKSFETITDVFICEEEWLPDNNMLTSAMKLNRHNIYDRYRQQIDEMFANTQ